MNEYKGLLGNKEINKFENDDFFILYFLYEPHHNNNSGGSGDCCCCTTVFILYSIVIASTSRGGVENTSRTREGEIVFDINVSSDDDG